MNVAIREARESDADAIHRMIVAIAAATGDETKVRSTVAELREHGFGERPAFTALLAERGGEVVGMSLFFPSFSTWRGQPGGYVQDFYIDPELRGTQVATALMDATVRAVQRWRGTYVRLSVDAANERARQFYRKTGFHWSTDEQIYVLDISSGDRCESRREE